MTWVQKLKGEQIVDSAPLYQLLLYTAGLESYLSIAKIVSCVL